MWHCDQCPKKSYGRWDTGHSVTLQNIISSFFHISNVLKKLTDFNCVTLVTVEGYLWHHKMVKK